MGFNTSAVIMNDALSSIKEDKELGAKLYSAVCALSLKKPIDICCGMNINALTVIETHHADQYVPILVGGNCGVEVDAWVSYTADDKEMALLRSLARMKGYNLVKKKKK